MKSRLHTPFFTIRSVFCALFSALLFFAVAARAPAQDTVTVSAADFQRLVYSAQLETDLALKPELEASLQVLLEMQRRNPNADPAGLVNVLTNALQIYRTREPFYIRTNGFSDEVLAAYLDALRQVPAHTNFISANLTLLNLFMLSAADYNYYTNDTVLDLINSADQRLTSAEGAVLNRQALVDACVARAQGNTAFAYCMDSLLWPETGVWLGETPSEIIGDTNSPLHDDVTMTNLLALSEASGNGSLTVSSNQLSNLFTNEMQTVHDTITTNLAVRAQINQSQPDWLAYLTNQAAMDANAQLLAAVQQGQPARLACATAAVLVQSKLQPVNTKSAEAEKAVSAGLNIGLGIAGLCSGNLGSLGGLMSGGMEVFNMFSGTQSPQEAMAAQLQNIEIEIKALSANLNYRFDRVDQSLTTIFNTMNQQFDKIEFMLNGQNQLISQLQGNVYDIRSSLVSAQASLDRIEAENFASFSAAQQDQIVGPINNDLIYTRYPATRGPLPEVGYGSSGGGYEADEGLFYKYAMNDANNDISSPSSSLDLSSSGLAQQLAARPLSANLNYIQQFLTSTLGVNTVGTPDPNHPLPNPQEWFIAAYAYLQLAGENPMYFRKDAPQREVSDIINRGQNDVNFCSNLTFNGTNINWSLYTALENYYLTNLIGFNAQVSAFEDQYATTNYFALKTWRQWAVAAPRVRATVSLDSAAATEVMVSPAMLLSPIPRHATSIAAGYSHSLALKADGTILGWGDNSYGQTTIPASATNVVAIAAGFYHSLALREAGTVIGWGDNTYGQTNVPAGLTNVVAIAAGSSHSLALKADGTVVGWGDNAYGQATGVPNTVPPYLSSGAVWLGGQTLTDVVAIAAGSFHSLALKADGTVVAWGDNGDGEATVPVGLSNVVAVAAGASHSLALKADGTIVGWGLDDDGQTNVPAGLTNVVAIAAGGDHSLALKADGTVVGWGDNNYGQTANPLGLTHVEAITAGAHHSLALKADGTVVAWGRIYERQCLVPPALTRQRALSASWGHFLGLQPDGIPIDYGVDADYGRPAISASATNVVMIAAGAFHSLALQPDGRIVAWGDIGVLAGLSNVVAVAAGEEHSLALKADGTVVGWGYNNYGQTNVPTGLTNVVAIAASRDSSLALKADGTVIGWGDTSYGLTNVPTGLTNVVAIAAGGYQSLALKADGTIVGWGDNSYGQTNIPSGLTNVVAIAAGDNHSLALKADGTVVGWGDNTYGQTNIPTGLSNVVAIAAAGDYCLALQAGGTVAAWGGALNGHTPISAGETNVVAIAAGNFYGLALKADGTVVGWGGNSGFGETTIPAGLSTAVAIVAGGYRSLALLANGTVIGWGDNDFGAATGVANGGPGLVTIGGSPLTNVVAIAGGTIHSLALKADGSVAGWGYNYSGQATGVPNTTYPFVSAVGSVKLAGQILTNVVAIAAGHRHSLALLANGTVVGWGDDTYGQINVPAGLTNIVAIAAGDNHSLALKADGTVVGWGYNNYGQATGVPNTVSPYLSSGPVSVAGQTLTNVVAIVAGSFHSLALKADGTAVGWGDNYHGQIIVPITATNLVAIAAGEDHSLFLKATATTGPTAGGNSFVVRAQTPVRVRALLQDCNQNMVGELALTGSALDNDAANLSGAKALLADVLQLGMPYTLEHDGVLHGFLYGSESLVDAGAATGFLNAQNAQLQVTTPDAPPRALTEAAALRYLGFQDRLNQCLTSLQATGQPEIPRLLGHTLRLLNLLHDAWVTPTNSPPPALEIWSQNNSPRLLLYGEPYMRYTLQYRDSLGVPDWTTTTITNLEDGQTNIAPVSGSSPARFYRVMLPTP